MRPFRRAEGQVWISPTRLAAALAGSGATPEATHGCVIVETNYRVCLRADTVQVCITEIVNLDCVRFAEEMVSDQHQLSG